MEFLRVKKTIKIQGWRGAVQKVCPQLSLLPLLFVFFFWYSPFLIFPPSVAYHLASSVMTSQGNLKIRWHCLFWQIHKFSKLGRNKRLIRKKNTLSKKVAPVPTYSGSFEVVLPNKDGSCIVQLFIRSLNSAI